MNNEETDILIIGGGLIGGLLLLALQALKYKVLLVDVEPFPLPLKAEGFDARSLALAPASLRILEQLKLWPALQANASAIEAIYVSQQHCFGATRLLAKEAEPLGQVVELSLLYEAIYKNLSREQLLSATRLQALDLSERKASVLTPAGEKIIGFKLLVAADGASSTVRKFCQLKVKKVDYGQQALIGNIALKRPHAQKAFERFTPQGPLAFLPLSEQRTAFVWALSSEDSKAYMKLDDEAFLTLLQKAFGYRLGKFLRVGKRHLYPLHGSFMPEVAQWPCVFIGNAANTLHPIAGQGLNLGLRDLAALVEAIQNKGLNPTMLASYYQMRKADHRAITNFTHYLLKLFTHKLPTLALLRSLGLIAVDHFHFLKDPLMRYSRGFGGTVSDLASGFDWT